MRFLTDEGISALTIAWLRERGHHVISVREQGLFSADDSFVLALALAHQAILLTRDVQDFSRIAHLAGEPHYGIILLRPGKDETPIHINSLLEKFIQQYAQTDLTSRIVVVTPKRVRFHPRLTKIDQNPT
jgi:predicted nuclease of predicted toxin-antitoxin system